MNRRQHEGALADRWALEGSIPLSGSAEGVSWHRARAARSGDPAAVMLVEGEAALETADAARRALLVEHANLLPVLDAEVLGEDAASEAADGPLTIVSYPFPPAPPLAALLSKGALRPETARSVIGEAATGLEAARRRGLRHVHLDSNRVFVDTRSGDVRVLGVGVETAAHGTADPSGDEASAADVVSLITLLFRALTGRVPRPGADGAFPRPSTLAARPVPEDLDDLCDRVLNGHEDVPVTTRELLEELGPWQSIPVTLQAYDPAEDAKPAGSGSDRVSSTDSSASDSGASGTSASSSAASTADVDAASTGGSGAGAAAVAAGAGLAGGAIAASGDGERTAASADDDAASGAPGAAATTADAAGSDASGADDTVSDAGTGSADAVDPAAAPDAADASAADVDPAAGDGPSAVRTGAFGAALAAGALSLREKAAARRSARQERLAARAETRAAEQAETEAADVASSDDVASADADATAPLSPSAEATSPGAEATSTDATGSLAAEADPADADRPGTDADAAADADTDADTKADADAEAAAASALEARGLVEDLHLTEHRSASAFPGTLAVVPAASRLAPDAADDDPALPPADRSAVSWGGTPDVEHEDGEDPDDLAAAVGPVIVGAAGDRKPEDGPIIVPGRSRPITPVEEEADAWSATPASYLRDVVGVAMDHDSDRTYALGAPEGLDRSHQAMWILVGGAVLVIVALVLAFSSITAALRGPATAPAAPTSSSAAEGAAAAAQSPAAEPAPAESPQPAAPPAIAAVTETDGGKPDHPENTGRMHDGDPNTVWKSKIYRSESFSNIKPGIGIAVDLAAPATVNAVVVTTKESQGGLIELRTVNDDGSMGDPVASGAFAGDGEVRLAPGAPLTTQKLMLWIPQAPTDSKGHRAQIAEIRVE